jgi:hypothetical protein
MWHNFLWMICFVILLLTVTIHIETFVGSRFDCPTRNMSYDLRGEAYYPPRIHNQGLMFETDIGVIDPYLCPRRILM